MTVQVQRLPLFTSTWYQVKDGDPAGLELFNRHYSKYHYKDGRKPTRFVGPGERIVLVTMDGKALFVWRKFIDKSGQKGVNCAVFRSEYKKEDRVRASGLILLAERYAHERWPNERLYTYVNPSKIQSPNPGYCFLKAGWEKCGMTKKRNLIILQKLNPCKPK